MSNLNLIKELRALTLAGMGDCRSALEESNWDMEKAVDLIKARGKNIASKNESKVATEGVVRIKEFSKPSGFSGASMVEVNCQTDFVANSPDFLSFVEFTSNALTDAAMQDQAFDVSSVGNERQELMSLTKEKIDVRRWWIEESSNPLVKVFNYTHSNNKIGVMLTLLAPSKEALTNDVFSSLGNDLCLQIAAMSPLAIDRDSVDPAEVDRQKEIFKVQLTESNKPAASWSKILEGKFNKWYSEVVLTEQESIVAPKTTIGQIIKLIESKLGGNIKVVNFIRCQVGEGLSVDKKDFADEVSQLVGESK